MHRIINDISIIIMSKSDEIYSFIIFIIIVYFKCWEYYEYQVWDWKNLIEKSIDF